MITSLCARVLQSTKEETHMTSVISEARASYHPVEQFYFEYFLGLTTELPEGIEHWSELDAFGLSDSEVLASPYVLLVSSWATHHDDLTRVNNAVARLVLETVAESLPNFVLLNHIDDSYITSRPPSARRNRSVASLPTFLFEINWATSGPGFTWEERYHVGYIAEYDVYIVTASQDSDDVYGFCDICIGHFRDSEDHINDSMKIISDWWNGKVQEYGAEIYEDITAVGSATIDQILGITAEVWEGSESD